MMDDISMANREYEAKRDMDMAKAKAMDARRAAREMTVGELLDRRIEKAERLLRTLHDLKGSLPGQFLNSGGFRISAFLEL